MSKFKFLVSFAFVLCLVLAIGTCAFAATNTISEDTPVIPDDGDTYENLFYTVGTNNGIVVYNSGTIVENRNTVKLNEHGHIKINYKTVEKNKGYITNNYGVVNENTPPTDAHHVGILNNFGSVTKKTIPLIPVRL